MIIRFSQFTKSFAIAIILAQGSCAHTRAPNQPPSSWQNSGFHPSLPNQPFSSYEAAFAYIAAAEGLTSDDATRFELAADSTLEHAFTKQTGDLVLVRADHFANSRFGWRGAQGQGRYYVFQTEGRQWRLVGILHGGGYRWKNDDEHVRIITWWHVALGDSPEVTYVWNGTFFE